MEYCAHSQCWQFNPCAVHLACEEPECSVNSAHLQVVCPGFVYLKGGLGEAAQQYWSAYAMHVGSLPEQPFFHLDRLGNKMLNNRTRGRIYGDIQTFPKPDKVLRLCHALVDIARARDPALPPMTPTHLLLNLYKTAAGMMWHADDDPNDGDNDHPIISISIGADCDFGYELDGKVFNVTLKSGDILIWGGPQRMLRHAVLKVYPATCPTTLTALNRDRLNFTFRDSPNMLGQEADWQITPPKY